MNDHVYQQIMAAVHNAVSGEFADDFAEARSERTEFLRLVRNDCSNPQGHVFRSACGRAKCLHCPREA